MDRLLSWCNLKSKLNCYIKSYDLYSGCIYGPSCICRAHSKLFLFRAEEVVWLRQKTGTQGINGYIPGVDNTSCVISSKLLNLVVLEFPDL